MALLPDEEMEEIVARANMRALTPHSLRTAAELRADLKQTRTRGYALDNEENEMGVRCIGAAVRDFTGRPVAAISVSAPSFRLTTQKVPVVARAVMRAAAAMAADLGFRNGRPPVRVSFARFERWTHSRRISRR